MTLCTGYVTRTTRETTTDKYTNTDNKNIVMGYFESVSLLLGRQKKNNNKKTRFNYNE